MIEVHMKTSIPRSFTSIGLALGFFVLWVIIMAPLLAPLANNAPSPESVWRRLGYEVAPLVAVLFATWVMIRRFDKQTTWPRICTEKRWIQSTAAGVVVGLGWLFGAMALMSATTTLHIGASQSVPWAIVWIAAAAINVVMQEYLVRGYLFSMLARRHSVAAASVVTTLVFVAMHGFEGGVLGVLNVTAAGAVFTVLLVRTGSLLAPIIAHALWNVVGAIGFGVVSLGGVYPHIMDLSYSGIASLESSATTLAASCLTAVLLWRFVPQHKAKTQNAARAT
ncbi:hypothetical protein CSA80_00575 [Candidatus Saccharibacteria bacterium]|nr:MAG: hypothetical protein CSA80_00575 [Candidatus Saccharibacteria bacterium]